MFSTLRKKLHRENSVSSSGTNSPKGTLSNRPTLPPYLTIDELNEMTESQIDALFQVFIAETSDIIWESSTSLHSLTTANKTIMLKAHLQRSEANLQTFKNSLNAISKTISSGKFDSKTVSSLRVLLTSSPIKVLEVFIEQRGLDLLLSIALKHVHKKQHFYQASNSAKLQKYCDLEMDLLKIIKFLLTQVAGINAFFEGLENYIRDILPSFSRSSSKQNSKYMMEILVSMSNLAGYAELLVNSLVRDEDNVEELVEAFKRITEEYTKKSVGEFENSTCQIINSSDTNNLRTSNSTEFSSTCKKDVSIELEQICLFLEFINNLIDKVSLAKRLYLRKELNKKGFDSCLQQLRLSQSQIIQQLLYIYNRELEKDLQLMNDYESVNINEPDILFDSIKGRVKPQLFLHILQNIYLMTNVDTTYMAVLEKLTKVVLFEDQGNLLNSPNKTGITIGRLKELVNVEESLQKSQQLIEKLKQIKSKMENDEKALRMDILSKNAQINSIMNDCNIKEQEILELQNQLAICKSTNNSLKNEFSSECNNYKNKLEFFQQKFNCFGEILNSIHEWKKEILFFRDGNSKQLLKTEFFAENKIKISSKLKALHLLLNRLQKNNDVLKNNEPSSAVGGKLNNSVVENKPMVSIEKVPAPSKNIVFSAIPAMPPSFNIQFDPTKLPPIPTGPNSNPNSSAVKVNTFDSKIFPKTAPEKMQTIFMDSVKINLYANSLWANLEHKKVASIIDYNELDEMFCREAVPVKEKNQVSEVKTKNIFATKDALKYSIILSTKINMDDLIKFIQDVDVSLLSYEFIEQLFLSFPKGSEYELLLNSISNINDFGMPEVFFLRLLQLNFPLERLEIMKNYLALDDSIKRCSRHKLVIEELFNSLMNSAYIKILLDTVLVVLNYLWTSSKKTFNSLTLTRLETFLATKTNTDIPMSDVIAAYLSNLDPNSKRNNFNIFQLSKEARNLADDELETAEKYMKDTVSLMKTIAQNEPEPPFFSQIKAKCCEGIEKISVLKKELKRTTEKCFEYFGYPANSMRSQFINEIFGAVSKLQLSFKAIPDYALNSDTLIESSLHKENVDDKPPFKHLIGTVKNEDEVTARINTLLGKVDARTTSFQIIEESVKETNDALKETKPNLNLVASSFRNLALS